MKNSFLLVSLGIGCVVLIGKLYFTEKAFNEYKLNQAVEAQEQMKHALDSFTKAQNELIVTNNITLQTVKQIEKTTDDSIAAINNGNARMFAISKELGETANSYTKANGLGNGASIELPRDVARNILTIKRGIEQDRAKILYLQDYIKKVDGLVEELNK